LNKLDPGEMLAAMIESFDGKEARLLGIIQTLVG
jgi:hypothetical protein